MSNDKKVKYCDAIELVYGEKVEACETCKHNACEYYCKAKRDLMDEETDYYGD